MNQQQIRHIFTSKGLKVTPQRVLVYTILRSSHEHPTADFIIDEIRKEHPSIAKGTVYNILDTFIEKGLVSLVQTEKDRMRYDAFLEEHHHLFDLDSEKISDYYDDRLSGIIKEYFDNNTIPGFDIKNVRLQISGKYTEQQTNQ